MRIVIAGAGEIGGHLAKMLSRESNIITVIDSNEEHLSKLSEGIDVVTVVGDPTSINVLEQANVQKADLFIAVSPAQDQNTNLLSAMLAKKLGAQKVTARVNNDEYLSPDNKQIFIDLGIDLLFYPEKTAAYEIIDLLRQTGTSEFMSFAKGRLQMVVFNLEEGAPIIGKKVKDLVPDGNYKPFKPVAINRESKTIIPTQETIFLQDDLVFIICTKEGAEEIMRYSGKDDIDIKSIMIVGGGRIGEMLVSKLKKSVDNIKIIEYRKERCEYLADKFPEALVINGDGRNTDLLIEEEAKSYDAFIAVTSSSETNILSCVAMKNLGVPKVIAEVENIEYIRLAEEMGVDTVINKKLSAASRIFRFTLSNQVRSIKCLNGSDAEVLEFVASTNSTITTAPIGKLNFPPEAIVGGVFRGKESFIPNEFTTIAPYDRVVVFALPAVLEKVNKFFL